MFKVLKDFKLNKGTLNKNLNFYYGCPYGIYPYGSCSYGICPYNY